MWNCFDAATISETSDKGILMAGNNNGDLSIIKLDSTLNGGCGMYPQNFTAVSLSLDIAILNYTNTSINLVNGISLVRDTLSFSKNVFCETATGIEANLSNKTSSCLFMFPNPVKDILLIKIKDEIADNSELIILDCLGRVREKIINLKSSSRINFERYSEGIYFLILKWNHKEIKNKIIKIN